MRDASMDYPGLSIAGPNRASAAASADARRRSRQRQDVPFLSFRQMDVGMIPALVGRVSFTGELGYEIWVRPEYQRALYHLLLEGGREARARAVRHARASVHATGEELRHLVPRIPPDLRPLRSGPRPLRRPEEERLHRPRRGGAKKRRRAASCACRPSPSKRATPTRSATSRSGTAAGWSAG